MVVTARSQSLALDPLILSVHGHLPCALSPRKTQRTPPACPSPSLPRHHPQPSAAPTVVLQPFPSALLALAPFRQAWLSALRTETQSPPPAPQRDPLPQTPSPCRSHPLSSSRPKGQSNPSSWGGAPLPGLWGPPPHQLPLPRQTALGTAHPPTAHPEAPCCRPLTLAPPPPAGSPLSAETARAGPHPRLPNPRPPGKGCSSFTPNQPGKKRSTKLRSRRPCPIASPRVQPSQPLLALLGERGPPPLKPGARTGTRGQLALTWHLFLNIFTEVSVAGHQPRISNVHTES